MQRKRSKNGEGIRGALHGAYGSAGSRCGSRPEIPAAEAVHCDGRQSLRQQVALISSFKFTHTTSAMKNHDDSIRCNCRWKPKFCCQGQTVTNLKGELTL